LGRGKISYNLSMALRTGNPTLKESTFASFRTSVTSASPAEVMTLNGTVHRTFFLLCLVVTSASFTWGQLFTNPGLVLPLMIAGLIGGLITALITCFKKEWSPITAPAYALLEGLALGGISALFEAEYPGIVLQAVGLTFGTLFALLAAYRSGLIKATENFKLGVVAATGGICLVYLANFVLSLFNVPIAMLHEGGTLGILFCLFVVVVAALNLVLDFDFIEQGVEYGAPKYMEWYSAFGLVVTLVWLYLEILRLLSYLQRRD
jgi:uncharacterized YccA/Bax inhibitor family protein